MSGIDKHGDGSEPEDRGQGGDSTPATGRAPKAGTNETAPSPVQERIRRQAELAEQIRAAAETEDAEPDYQSATLAGRLHRRLKAAAEVQ